MRAANQALIEAGLLLRAAESLAPRDADAEATVHLISRAEEARRNLPRFRLQLEDAQRRLGLETTLANIEFPGDADIKRLTRDAEQAAQLTARAGTRR